MKKTVFPHRLLRINSLEKTLKFIKTGKSPSSSELKENSMSLNFAFSCFRCPPFCISNSGISQVEDSHQTPGAGASVGSSLSLSQSNSASVSHEDNLSFVNVERCRPFDNYEDVSNHYLTCHTKRNDTIPKSQDSHNFFFFCPLCVNSSESIVESLMAFCCLTCGYFHLETMHYSDLK